MKIKAFNNLLNIENYADELLIAVGRTFLLPLEAALFDAIITKNFHRETGIYFLSKIKGTEHKWDTVIINQYLKAKYIAAQESLNKNLYTENNTTINVKHDKETIETETNKLITRIEMHLISRYLSKIFLSNNYLIEIFKATFELFGISYQPYNNSNFYIYTEILEEEFLTIVDYFNKINGCLLVKQNLEHHYHLNNTVLSGIYENFQEYTKNVFNIYNDINTTGNFNKYFASTIGNEIQLKIYTLDYYLRINNDNLKNIKNNILQYNNFKEIELLVTTLINQLTEFTYLKRDLEKLSICESTLRLFSHYNNFHDKICQLYEENTNELLTIIENNKNFSEKFENNLKHPKARLYIKNLTVLLAQGNKIKLDYTKILNGFEQCRNRAQELYNSKQDYSHNFAINKTDNIDNSEQINIAKGYLNQIIDLRKSSLDKNLSESSDNLKTIDKQINIIRESIQELENHILNIQNHISIKQQLAPINTLFHNTEKNSFSLNTMTSSISANESSETVYNIPKAFHF